MCSMLAALAFAPPMMMTCAVIASAGTDTMNRDGSQQSFLLSQMAMSHHAFVIMHWIPLDGRELWRVRTVNLKTSA